MCGIFALLNPNNDNDNDSKNFIDELTIINEQFMKGAKSWTRIFQIRN